LQPEIAIEWSSTWVINTSPSIAREMGDEPVYAIQGTCFYFYLPGIVSDGFVTALRSPRTSTAAVGST
ncbi:hypothetical protein AX16_008236, partial [Volvariella volvacea WC 439]